MTTSARLTSKGQVTIPKTVRDALHLATGDSIVFRVEGHRAVVARTPDLLDVGGVVSSTDAPSSWDDVLRRVGAR